MDKREVLRRLDQLCLELSSEEGMLKYLCNEMNGNAPLYYVYYGKMIGVEWTKGELERCGYIRIKTFKYPAGGRPVTIIELTKEGKENGYLL